MSPKMDTEQLPVKQTSEKIKIVFFQDLRNGILVFF